MKPLPGPPVISLNETQLLSEPVYVDFNDGSTVRLEDRGLTAHDLAAAGITLRAGLVLVLYDLDGETPEDDLVNVGEVRGRPGAWVARVEARRFAHVEELPAADRALYVAARRRQLGSSGVTDPPRDIRAR